MSIKDAVVSASLSLGLVREEGLTIDDLARIFRIPVESLRNPKQSIVPNRIKGYETLDPRGKVVGRYDAAKNGLAREDAALGVVAPDLFVAVKLILSACPRCAHSVTGESRDMATMACAEPGHNAARLALFRFEFLRAI